MAPLGAVLAAHNPIERLAPGGPRSRGQKLAVTVSVVANLSLLGFFKYFMFAQETLNHVIEAFGGTSTAVLQIDDTRLTFGDRDPTQHYRYVLFDDEVRVIDDVYFNLLSLPAQHFAAP